MAYVVYRQQCSIVPKEEAGPWQARAEGMFRMKAGESAALVARQSRRRGQVKQRWWQV